MPIYEAAGSLICHFGHGDILIATGRNAEKEHEDELVFVRQEEPRPIGEWSRDAEGQRSDEIDAPVRLVFDNLESLDVLSEMLSTLRGKMVKARDVSA